jgi:transposase
MVVAITRDELSASDLRREAARCRDANAARRMLALALVLEGHSREAAARHTGPRARLRVRCSADGASAQPMLDRQTLRDWVHRYNAQGLAGLRNRRHPGPKPRLTPEQLAELDKLVEQGPDPARDGVVRWRRVDLQALIKARFEVELHERSVGKVLRRLGFTRLSVRPKHPASDPEAQERFKKGSPSWSVRSCPSTPAASQSRSGSRTRPAWASRAP